jgi:glycosyltransferase involved in cell wall biosynthesis
MVVAGEGTQRANVERAAQEAGVAGRIDFLGAVDDEQLVALYRDTLAVLYPPYDEDFGYVTLEAFLSRKPVVTATDSGGPNEFVVDGVNGFSVAPEPDAIAGAINALARDRGRAAAMGDAGFDRARTITWDGVIEKLVGQPSDGQASAGGKSPQATASAQRGGEASRGPAERSDQ